MKKILLALSMLVSVSGMAQVSYFVQSPGTYVAYGLSTDTKPSSPPTGSYFIEVNTGNIYYATGSAWTLPSLEKTIKSVSDFPTPVSGVITLADNTAYRISGTVDVGTNVIQCGTKNTIYGTDKQNDILTGTTTDTLIMMNSTSVNKGAVTFRNMTLKCPNGMLFSVTSPSTSGVIIIDNCNISAVKNVGRLKNITSFSMRNSAILSTVTNGIVIEGTNTYFIVRDNQFRLSAGTVFGFGTSTFTNIDINRNFVDEAASQTFMSGTTGGANVTNSGHITNNIFSGAGTFCATIGVSDAGWNFANNIGTTNTALSVVNGGTGAITSAAARTALGLVIGTDVLAPNGSAASLTSFPTLNQNTTGSAASLTTGRTINGTSFNGTANITLGTASVTLAQMADMATGSMLGRNTAGTGVPEVLSAATTKSLLSLNNVTNESKATMFTSPTFTGTATGIGIPVYARVTGSNATTTGQALVDVTGLSVALTTNATYEFEAILSVSTTAVLTGTAYGVNYSVAGGTVEAQITGASTSTTTKTLRINALNTATTLYLATSAQTGGILIKGIVTTGANAGNFTVQHLKLTSGTSTVFINSFLKVTRIL